MSALERVVRYGVQKMFYTKADMLRFLSDKVTLSRIEHIMTLSGNEYYKDMDKAAGEVCKEFAGGLVVVRSSSSMEDGEKNSNAGHFDSVLNVDSSDPDSVKSAIERVFASYDSDVNDEEVLIQNQVKDAVISGVLFTRDIKGNRPYYVINYDDKSTDTVTAGLGGRILYVWHECESTRLKSPFDSLLTAAREIEDILPDYPLDIEWAVDSKGEVIIFQTRPFAAAINGEPGKLSDDEWKQAITGAVKSYESVCNELGEPAGTMLSDMAFWNPAEMIGTNPHPLDYSLYREIITKHAFNQGLNYIGYREVEGELMYKIGNKPYISLKQSFLCLTPDDLENRLVRKLIKYYNKKLLEDRTAHDKIEFEIVFSNYDFTTEEKLAVLRDEGFTEEEIDDIRDALFNLTNNAICNFKLNRMKDLRALNGLRVHRENTRNNWIMSERTCHTSIGYFVELIESIKQYGTPKFARQARLAFISKALCRSFVSAGYFTSGEIDDFMMSIYTVAAEYDADFQDLVDGRITRVEFDERYGHLRSGTYDITCDTYEKREFDMNKGSANARKQRQRLETLKHNPLNVLTIIDALDKLGFYVDATEFVEFLKESMEEREYFKFEFTKSLSLALDILADLGEYLGLTREEMSYLTFNDIVKCANIPEEDIAASFKADIDKNRSEYRTYSELVLPDVIADKTELDVVHIVQARPNFITSDVVTGDVVCLEDDNTQDVAGKIVVIQKADPGFDWIFAKGIKGFITKYGGVASHMAIRCAEFNIPAAIGCGDVIYNRVCSQDRIILDCRKGKIEMVD